MNSNMPISSSISENGLDKIRKKKKRRIGSNMRRSISEMSLDNSGINERIFFVQPIKNNKRECLSDGQQNSGARLGADRNHKAPLSKMN